MPSKMNDILIGHEPLRYFRELSTVRFPDGLEKIGSFWFSNSGIQEAIIPASVREIGSHAFEQCD